MNNPGSLLSTLAQSAAVFVAIVGGFLVSRLVAISSERDGLKRRYKEARDQLKHVATAYENARDYRLRNSKRAFRGWVLDALVDATPEAIDREALLANKIPRGSSREEMEPYLERLLNRVKEVTDEIEAHLVEGDTRQITLDDLAARGLVVPEVERDLYLQIIDSIASQLPRAGYGLTPNFRLPGIVTAEAIATNARRLDESIREEQELHARMRILETEVGRLRSEIELAGRPTGVTSAIVILAIYSLLGIVAPVVVLAVNPKTLANGVAWTLVALFVTGLFAVLGYILWYARTLNNVTGADEIEPSPREEPPAAATTGDGSR